MPKASFFCVGQQVIQFGELPRDIVEGGHTIWEITPIAISNAFGFLAPQKRILGRNSKNQ